MRQLFITVLLLTIIVTTDSNAQGPTLVVTEPIVAIEFQDQITLVGRSRAVISSRIVAEVSGRIKTVDAAEGNSVKAGSPLASVDRERIRLSYESKSAQMKRAEAEAMLAQGTLDKANKLFAQSLVSEDRLDSARAGSAIAQANFSQLEADANRLKLDLDNCTISAPFDGYTGRQLVDVGEWVNIGDPIFEMVDISQVKITVDLPEKHFGHLKKGSTAIVIISGNEQNQLTGIVTGIAPNASETTHTFPVIITVNNQDGSMAGGMLVRATLNLNSSFKSLAVSKDAIIRQGLQTMIYTVVDHVATMMPVTISSSKENLIAISGSGLTAGMPIVVRGNERIFPGSPVMIEGEPPPDTKPVEDSAVQDSAKSE